MDTTVLNRQRGSIKAQITRITTCLSEDVDEIKLNNKLELITKLETKFDELKVEYYKILKDEQLEEYENGFLEIDDSIQDIKVSFKRLLNSITTAKNENNVTTVKHDNIVKHTNVKLPEIPLPRFSGLYTEWLYFKSQFKMLIDENHELTDQQKLYYLQSALVGDAKQIESLEDSYQSLWKALVERFENKRLIVNGHIHEILNFNKLKVESSKELQTLIDSLLRNLRALNQLEIKQNKFSELMLINIIIPKLDPETRKMYEMSITSNDLPDWDAFIALLQKRLQIMENIHKDSVSQGKERINVSKSKVFLTKESSNVCKLCKKYSHPLYKCPTYQSMEVQKRFEFVKRNRLCTNCLSNNHESNRCVSNSRCVTCEKRHHSSIHFRRASGAIAGLPDTRNNKVETHEFHDSSNDYAITTKPQTCELSSNCLFSRENKNVLLSTAKVKLMRSNRKFIELFAVLDTGSMRNLLTEEAADLLGFQKSKCRANLFGIKNTVVTINEKIRTRVANEEETFGKELEFLILPEIAGNVPAEEINISNLNLPQNIKYANPSFYLPQKISLLLGGEIFYELLRGNQIKLKGNSIILIETVFGWMVTGSIPARHPSNSTCCFVQDHDEDGLKKFWELESLGILENANTDEEDKAITHFEKSIQFENGRYTVGLPWKRNYENLNDNLSIARKRLNHLNLKFERYPELYHDYQEILKDYEIQGIIERIPNDKFETQYKPLFYLPFSMVRRDSVSSKKRIVFDASSHAEGELSLNDCLYAGLSYNPLIFDMLIFFRLNSVVVLADIEKAFLQISLNEKDRNAVRFLFPSSNPGTSEHYDIQIFRFCRVLFGVNASPFLLSATIKEHIEKFRELHPATVEMLDKCFYVDDFIGTLDNVPAALQMSQEAKRIMADAGMKLYKWSSNNRELVQLWKDNGFETHPIHSEVNFPNKLQKVLGLPWHIHQDYITIDVKELLNFNNLETVTKRIVLSTAGKLHDVLGLLTPFTIRLKCLLQELWLRKCSWDAELPADLLETYTQWRSELSDILNLQVPRMILDSNSVDANQLQIHVFSDASQKAYGTAVYLRVKYGDKISVNLIASKSRVAPLKRLTIPKLELMGALLAARLAKEVEQTIRRKGSPTVHFWTDSQITLFWIKGPHHKWKQFVSNRVREIQSLSNPDSWSHVPGKLNIADLITRGTSAEVLLKNEAWWSGPEFLKNNEVSVFECGNSVPEESYISELKKEHFTDGNMCFTVTDQSVLFVNDFLKITNNFCKLIRIVSYVYRFIHNCRNPKDKKCGYLDSSELNNSEFFLLKFAQGEYLKEISALEKGENVKGKSKLSSLNCFLDKNGLIRVGGRIIKSNVNDNSKHPIVISPKHPLTYMIVQYFHLKYLHVGSQALTYLIRQKYWPLNARNLCKLVIRNCVTCTKNKPILEQQLMGQLPKERVEPTPPFTITGIDFCGPFYIKYKGQRKGVLNKIYVAIYVCFCTKAIHLDFVSDLTSTGFIASLKRFFSRRGKASKIFTDNGRNFIGAEAELKRLLKVVNSPDESLAQYFTEEKIDWHFSPPKSPNFGGLYEAGVKSFKFHLKRIAGNSHFTLEEFITVLTEIEGVLNSRPLTPLSADFDNFETLTPGHFLIGRPITSIAEPQLTDIEENRLSKWEKVSKCSQRIWRLWKRDYLNNLQERHKWQFTKNNIKIGTLVLVKEETLPGTKWLTGRVVEIFNGSDGRVRVVNIRLPQGNILKRSVRNICILPVY